MACVWCGEMFNQRRRDKRHCSTKCSKANYRADHAAEIGEYARVYGQRWRAANREKMRDYNIAYHAEHYDPKQRADYYAATRQRFSEYNAIYRATHQSETRERLRRWRAANPEKVKAAQARRRAAKYQTPRDYFLDREIFERDRWRCGICGKRVNRKLQYPHTRSASIDHVIPLGRGGSHTRDNVQLAHYGCNAAKRTQTTPRGEQLRIIG